MKFFRKTVIATVQITTKGGAQIVKDFTTFDYAANGDGFTSLKWKTADNVLFFIDVNQVAAVNEVKRRRVYRFR